MDSDRWNRINTIFHDALDLAPGDRQGFVVAASLGDQQLQSEVEALLLADEDAGSYLESPLVGQNSATGDTAMLEPDTLLCGRFRIVHRIAEGGMGQVYEALDMELCSPVALKVIRPEIASDPAVLARFRQEVKLARRITHPNVCRTYDFERDVIANGAGNKQRDIYFLTMEFLSGETLASRIRRTGALSTDMALAIARQVADAIDSAHSLGIIHRDLKPGNLMLTSRSPGEPGDDLRAVITDFGLARVTPVGSDDDAPSISKSNGWPIGTMTYMSPEQLEGSKVSAATDIYSFGLILFEMIAGRRAFPAESFLEGITQRIAGLSPEMEPQRIPQRWRDAIHWCIQAHPTGRPVLAMDAVQILQGSRSLPLRTRLLNRTGLKKSLWIISLLLLSLLLYFGRPVQGIYISNYTQLTHDGVRKYIGGTDGIRVFMNSGPTSTAFIPVAGGEIKPIATKLPGRVTIWDVSRDGSKLLVKTTAPEDNSLESLWSLSLPSGSIIRLGAGPELRASFTPNADSAIYVNAQGDLYESRTGDAVTRMIAFLGPNVTDVCMSPDGKVIRFFKDGRPWDIFPDGTGLHQVFPDWHGLAKLVYGRWSPRGDFYALLEERVPGINQIWVVDESRNLYRRHVRQPVQLTSGPVEWDRPIPGENGIFSVGMNYRGELSQVDPRTRQLRPFLSGISAEHLTFSPDRQAVAYTTYPDRLLIKAKSDGSNPVQLTDSSMSFTMNPKWSPTGDRLLFTEAPMYATPQAYVVSSHGGKPQRLLPNDREDEEDSDWSPDGTKVVLSGGNPKSEDQRYIRVLDLASNTWTKVKGSEGLVTPQWSPDGRYIVALSSRTRSLHVFDLRSQHWSELRATSNISCAVVSSDGQYVYYMQSAGPTPRTYEIYRIRVTGGKPQLMADLKPWPLDGLWGPSMTLDPSDTPIVTRDAGTSDVYSLQIGFK